MRVGALLASLAGLLLVASAPALAESSAGEGAVCEPGGAGTASRKDPAATPAAFAQANAARDAIEAGRLDGASARLEAALAAGAELSVHSQLRLRIHVARSQARLAAIERGAAAKAATRRAAELLEQTATTARDHGVPRLEAFAWLYLGEIYEGRERTDEALTLTRRALLVADRARAGDAIYRSQWQLGRLLRALRDVAGAISAYRQAVAQLDMLRADVAQSSTSDAFAFRKAVEPVYLELVDLLLSQATAPGDSSGPSAQAEEIEEVLQAAARKQALLAEARDRLESLKAAELRDYFQDACLVAQRQASPEDVPGAIVLYPVVLSDRVALILSTGSGLSLHEAGVSGETLNADVRRLRQLLVKRTTRQYLVPAQQLYDWLVRPIESALGDGSGSTLVVVPSGALRTIPFAALHDAKTGRFLIEKIPIAVTPGLTLTDPRPIDTGRARSLVASLSESVQGYPALEYAEPEAEQVAAVFPGVLLENADFSISRFEEELGQRAVSVVHIASHGEINGDPEKSFVLTWDGRIPMDRLGAIIGQTRLRTEAPLELLVLSDCQTASGDERAALGLAGVALSAGARSALATLWSVDDAATARLIQRFYEAVGSGESRARALQRAQVGLVRAPSYAHPFYWAPYMLIDSWL